MDEHPRRHLVLLLERPQLAVVLVQEPLGRPLKRVREPRRHVDAGEIGTPAPELGLEGRHVDPQVRTQPFPHPVDEQPATVVHVQVGEHHVSYGCEIDAGGLQSLEQLPGRGKFKPGSAPIPASMSMVRSPLRTTTSFSAHSSTSGGRNMSCSQATRTAGSALWPNIAPGSDSTPSLTTITSISPTRSA